MAVDSDVDKNVLKTDEEEAKKEKDGILGTILQWEWVEEKLTAALGTSAKFGSNKSVERIGVGQGFVSFIGRICPDWVGSDCDLPKTVVVKLPTSDNIRKITVEQGFLKKLEHIGDFNEEELFNKFEELIKTFHNAEVAFYKMVQSKHLDIQVPKCYVLQEYTKDLDQGAIIMEDLGKDAHVIHAFQSVSPTDMIQILDTIASVHAYSIQNDDWRKIKLPRFSDMADMGASDEMMLAFTKMSIDLDVEKMTPLMDKLEKNFKQIYEPKLMDDICDRMGIASVLAHGDLWSANIMWISEGETHKLAAVIDWQIIHVGCAAEDIARILCSALTTKDRRSEWENLVQKYYQLLIDKLGGVKPPFSLDQLKACFKRIFPFAGVMILPVFGPFVQQYAQRSVSVDELEKVKTVVREKAVGLLEDIIYYFELRDK